MALVTQTCVQDAERISADHVGVGFDLSADDDFAQPERGLDHDLRAIARGRIRREHHPRGVRADHRLDDDGHRRLGDDSLGVAVCDDPTAVQRRPAVDDSLDDRVDARDVGEGLVHSGERCVGSVFSDR